jgi:hypothetical protein
MLTLKKTFQFGPELLINAEHYGLVLAPKAGKKKDTIKFGRPIFATLGTNVAAFINIVTSMF